ncbi:MAG TPA: hypothetical protein VN458_00865 [Solirubrobacterales bacterium]|nr:hypothetical protein [Solirubrobacterales bacterium]
MTAAPEQGGGANAGGADAAERFARAGLELLDLEADEAEIAVIEAADRLYRPVVEHLLEAEFDGVDPEPGADMSRPPA